MILKYGCDRCFKNTLDSYYSSKHQSTLGLYIAAHFAVTNCNHEAMKIYMLLYQTRLFNNTDVKLASTMYSTGRHAQLKNVSVV